ncbi:MAG: molecular chaperone HtpG [Gammaproteobacteria bacterium]|nr:MAG: molecular chaperone HtpG [Gammaproteobacteria bacterium]
MTKTTGKETHVFQTEVKQLLHLMVHSLYSNKEIFLRELISNAADAADKLRFMALDNDALYAGDNDLKIRITTDKDAGTLTISDNGVGMNRDDIVSNLGTIARSGTSDFVKNLTGDQKKDSTMIGQFGVGFYSSFIVADKVTVVSRAAGDDAEQAVQWESAGEGEYSLDDATRESRGTDIILHLKEEEKEFLESYRPRSIVGKYSDHISLSVEMVKEPTPEYDDEGKPKEVEAPAEPEFESINKATALWTRQKNDISTEEYQEFYKHISHDYSDAMTWSHNRVEGKLEYTSLLYIPSKAPFDMWNRDKPRGIKLYVQRVFIMDEAEQFLPVYLRFVRGLIDSNDLPLNVSREILQDSKVTASLRNASSKRVLGMLQKMADNKPEEYQTFWDEFGQALKEGPAEDMTNKEAVAKLLRFSSTETDSTVQNVSLTDYVTRMKEGQEKIYFVSAENFETAKNSPHLEVFRKKGIEVLILSDRIDEWLVMHLTDFDGKSLQSVARGELELGDLDSKEDKKALKKASKTMKPFIKRNKESLGEQVADVRVTDRLTESPACIVGGEDEMGSQLSKMMQAAGQAIPETKPILEINPDHEIIQQLQEESDEQRFGDWINVLLGQALLAERGQLENPSSFARQLNQLLLQLTK